MNRLTRVATTAVAGIVLVVALAMVLGSRPAPFGAAPGGSRAADLTAPPNVTAERSPTPRPTVLVAAESHPPVQTARPANVPPDNIPDLPLTPAVEPEPPTAGCQNVSRVVDRAEPMYLEERFHLSDRAVLATVIEIGPAQWNTPDGKSPEDWRDAGPSEVMRLVRFSVDQVWKGDVDGLFVASIQGGDIGCWSFMPDPAEVPEVNVGQQFALFLRGSPKPPGLEGAHHILTILTVDEQGRIVTPEEGHLTSAEVAERAQTNTLE